MAHEPRLLVDEFRADLEAVQHEFGEAAKAPQEWQARDTAALGVLIRWIELLAAEVDELRTTVERDPQKRMSIGDGPDSAGSVYQPIYRTEEN